MKKKVLVIEDEEEIRKDIAKILSINGFEVFQANNGKEGINVALTVIPNLIICDIMMPEMDGLSVLQELKKYPSTELIPFIFLTAKSSRQDIREGMNLGADDYITKPFDFDELIAAVHKRIEKSEATEKKFNSKYEMLANSLRSYMPHEVRTPLNIILGLSDFLRKHYDQTSYNEARSILQNINESAKRIQRLFENYLFFSKLQLIISNPDEVAKLRQKKTPLADFLIRDIVVYSAGNAGRSNDIELDLEEANLAVPEDLFMKTIEEILDNAYKFSERGKPIKINSNISNDYYFIHITDFGRGMTLEQISSIAPYIQFERDIYEQQGSGLGLAIVKAIAKIVCGEILIKSQPNVYTTVTIKFPILKSEK
ncbi:MAG: response regulator [Bacteroidota bacterium]